MSVQVKRNAKLRLWWWWWLEDGEDGEDNNNNMGGPPPYLGEALDLGLGEEALQVDGVSPLSYNNSNSNNDDDNVGDVPDDDDELIDRSLASVHCPIIIVIIVIVIITIKGTTYLLEDVVPGVEAVRLALLGRPAVQRLGLHERQLHRRQRVPDDDNNNDDDGDDDGARG